MENPSNARLYAQGQGFQAQAAGNSFPAAWLFFVPVIAMWRWGRLCL